jgi:predicted esterase
MLTRTIRTETHGRTVIVPALDAAGLVVAFHGYGESAEQMLDDVRRIPEASRWSIASVQGLHRFYNRGNEVVASWMTRQDRDLAIADNLAYVDAAVELAIGECGEPRKLVMIGFSQGVAMAYRAAVRGARRVDGLLMLAGDVPPDIDGPVPRVLIGRGSSDNWYTAEKMDADLQVLRRLGARVEPCVFDGKHEWSPPFLAAAGRFLANIEAGGE